MTTHYTWPPNEWAGTGPGSQEALQLIFPTPAGGVKGIESEAIVYLYTTQSIRFLDAGIAPLKLNVDDIEHSLCEFAKYSRLAVGKARSKTGRKWERTSAKLLPCSIRPPCEVARLLSATESSLPLSSVPSKIDGSGDDDDDGDDKNAPDEYEINNIVRSEIGSDGQTRFLVKWKDYPQANTDEDWFLAKDLEGSSAVLEEWRTKAKFIEKVNIALGKL